MKFGLLIMMGLMLAACSSTKANKIKTLKFAETTRAKSVGEKEFSDCKWTFVGNQFMDLSVDQALANSEEKFTFAKDVTITRSGFGISSVGRFCENVKGEFYVEN